MDFGRRTAFELLSEGTRFSYSSSSVPEGETLTGVVGMSSVPAVGGLAGARGKLSGL